MLNKSNMTFTEYIVSDAKKPLLIQGEAKEVLASLPSASIDMVITSPPYYMKREYLAGGIGLEDSYLDYIDNLVVICKEIYFHKPLYI